MTAIPWRYSRWDGSQDHGEVDADRLVEEMSEELLNHGDVWRALRRMFRDGRIRPFREGAPSLQQMLKSVHGLRQKEMRRYDLGSVLDEYRSELQSLVAEERSTVEDRLDAALKRARDHPGDRGAHTAERLTRKKQKFLERLPGDLAGDMKSLQEYDFLNPEAQRRFQELVERLREQVGHSMFRDMAQTLRNWGQAEKDRMREFMRDLNQMLRERIAGQEPDFQGFMSKHGDMFGDNRPQNLDELLERMRRQSAEMGSLLASLPADQRQELQAVMDQLMEDESLRWEMSMLSRNLGQIWPDAEGTRYSFYGSESVSMQEAQELMGRMHDIDSLEQQLQDALRSGNVEGVDPGEVERQLGPEARDALAQMQQVLRALRDAGYLDQSDDGLTLTPAALRRIGQKALRDIFGKLSRDQFGGHVTDRRGTGGDRTEESKEYEFGDPFHLDLRGTVQRALERGGARPPLRLDPADFQVFRTEMLTQSATVLLLDMSRSMWLRGCFLAAKKVAVALDTLIRTQFPRDSLYVVGFSRYARELKAGTLPALSWDEEDYGTNLQHALITARELLGRHRGGNRQVVLITDGEPTAHLEDGRAFFSYPPTQRTFDETMREVVRCTREGIVINTFMLERGGYLAEFVNRITRINRGRAFFVMPERLGEYILVDYLDGKRRRVS
ncbi:MAG: vWA domain-containing protein [Candidatus Dormibacteria bacterium]